MKTPKTLLRLLDRTVRFAFENSAFYQRLYVRYPRIRSEADFQALPKVTKGVIRKHASGLLDCLSVERLWGKEGILDATSPASRNSEEFPFTTVENSSDFDRRYFRVHGILIYAGVTENERLLIVCDAANIYFASDLEDVLTKWEVTILIRDGLSAQELRTFVNQLNPQSLLLVTRRPFGHQLIPPSCKSVLTLMGRHSFPLTKRIRTVDVYTTDFFAWMGARREPSTFYRTNEIFLSRGREQPQIFLECDGKDELLVTTLFSKSEPPLLPFVRFAVNDRVAKVVGSRFELLR